MPDTRERFDERSRRSKEFGEWLKDQYVRWTASPKAPSPTRGAIPTQNQFAAYLGINPTSLTYYIQGSRFPDEDMAQMMADVLGPKVYDLLGYPRKMPRDPEITAMVDKAVKMTKSQQKEVLMKMDDMIADEEQRIKTRNSSERARQRGLCPIQI